MSGARTEAEFLAREPEVRHLLAVQAALLQASVEVSKRLGPFTAAEMTKGRRADERVERERSTGLTAIDAALRSVDHRLDALSEMARGVNAADLPALGLKAALCAHEEVCDDPDDAMTPLALSLAYDVLLTLGDPNQKAGAFPLAPEPDGNLVAIGRSAAALRAERERLDGESQEGSEGDAYDTVSTAWAGLCQAIAAIPATTLAGFRVKVEAFAGILADDPDWKVPSVQETADAKLAWSMAVDLARSPGILAAAGGAS